MVSQRCKVEVRSVIFRLHLLAFDLFSIDEIVKDLPPFAGKAAPSGPSRP
jgi:hypothetical protein